jgi:hypothetical protein
VNRALASFSAIFVLGSGFCLAQANPTSDPQALTLAAQSLNAMTGGTAFTDATLTGNVTRTVGANDDNGTASFKIRLGTGSRLDLNLGKGQRTEIHNRQNASPKTSWSGPDHASHAAPLHNSWVDNGWYFPATPLASMISDPQVSLSYVGQESRNGMAVEHLRASRHVSGQSATVAALVESLSTVDLYLDAATALPAALAFNGHPDNDAGVDFPIEIQFSNYQLVNGSQVPMTVEKFVNGVTFLKISFTQFVPNSGLAVADFQIQ